MPIPDPEMFKPQESVELRGVKNAFGVCLLMLANLSCLVACSSVDDTTSELIVVEVRESSDILHQASSQGVLDSDPLTGCMVIVAPSGVSQLVGSTLSQPLLDSGRFFLGQGEYLSIGSDVSVGGWYASAEDVIDLNGCSRSVENEDILVIQNASIGSLSD